MGYRTLKSIFHEHNESKMKEEYIKRFHSLASFNTNINIIPMENGKKVNDLEYPLCNLWIDGHQTQIELTAVKTKKKIVTIQELDVQLRNYLNKKYKLYEQGGDIVKGYVIYHNDDEKNVEYDFYNLNGEYGHEVLKMYADNKTINSDKLHLDIYLFKS